MNTFGKLLFGSVLSAALVGPSSAAVVQGISFPDVSSALQIDAGSFSQTLDTTTGILTGFGKIGSFDNDTYPIPAGYELTFVFENFLLDEPASSITELFFTGGTVTLYSDSTPNFNINNGATAADTDFAEPFLVLEGHMFWDIAETGGVGTIAATLGGGTFLLDVVGGAAKDHFDTTSIIDFLGGFADLEGTSSVVNYVDAGGTTVGRSAFISQVTAVATSSLIPTKDPSVDVLDFFKNKMGMDKVVATGSIDLTGAVQAVPEPGTIALLGGALLGLAVTRRRRS